MEKNRWYKQGDSLRDEIAAHKARPRTGGDCAQCNIWFFGQSGFVLEINRMVLYIDVLLCDLTDASGNTRRNYPPPFASDCAQALDYVICTHNHADHCNLNMLRPLFKSNPEARLVAPAPLKDSLTGSGVEAGRFIGAVPGEKLDLGHGVELWPVRAEHGGKKAGDLPSGHCLAYVVRHNGLSVFHAGDTYATPELARDVARTGGVDIALLPINGEDEARVARGIVGNMGPREAAWLAGEIAADVTVPAHYDMVRGNEGNPAEFVEWMYRLHPEKRMRVMALGEKLSYSKGSTQAMTERSCRL